MAHEIKVPAVGESVSEGTIAQWLKADGDLVKKGENLVVLDTEKASQDIQAEHTGRLKIAVPAGKDVSIGAVIGTIEEVAGSEATSAATVSAAPAAPAARTEKPAADTSAAVTATENARPDGVFPAGSPGAAQQPLHVAAPQPQPGLLQPGDQKGKAAPAAQPAAQAPSAQDGNTPAAPAEAAATPHRPAGDQRESREPMTRMRRAIAAHLLKARNETAMLTTFAEVDMSAVMELRKKHQDSFTKRHGIKLGFMSFFMKACVDALQEFPLVNASLDGNDIVYHHYVNLAIAVSTDRGLAVPVIRDAQDLTFAELERALADLAQKAKTGRIPLEDLKGGTFTLTNGGVFGSLLSTPLINPPQVAILGMHAIVERPVVINKGIEIRPMMNLALSYDHRLIDGKEAVQFLVHIRDRVAAPERLLLGL